MERRIFLSIQAPLIGSIIGISNAQGINPIMDMRFVIFSSAVGTHWLQEYIIGVLAASYSATRLL
ncbi:hypothetical protein [Desulfosporosinus sp. FKA]|uniref:hypothetical protein n=1 Tax=Desulfosporosinus sp. FKA TaxID=1969834 RepID=UPI000B4A15DB|nr:hypothetical protein [Desulfosporosinus sp. FKA]